MKKNRILLFAIFIALHFVACKKKNFNEELVNQNPTGPGAVVINAISPTYAQYGNTITIAGKNFGTLASSVGVKINGTTIAFNLLSDSIITATIPIGVGSGPVAITKNNATTTGPNFEYLFTGRTSLFAGNGDVSPVYGTATTVGFRQLEGFDFDNSGNMFICDYLGQRVVKVATNATVTYHCGYNVGAGNIGQSGPSSFYQGFTPSDITISATNRPYITDGGQHTICTFRNDSALYIAGAFQSGYSNTVAYASQFNLPRSIKLSSNNKLLVSDLNNHCIRNIDPSSTSSFVTTLAATNSAGDAVGAAANARFNLPAFITQEDNNNILVADFNNAKIKRVNITTGNVTTVVGSTAGNVLGPIANARITKPNCAVKNNQGNILIAEYESGYVKCISPSGIVYNLVGNGTITGYQEGAGTAARFKQLGKIIAYGNNTFYLADIGNRRIRKIILE
jgi:hypothetical protein